MFEQFHRAPKIKSYRTLFNDVGGFGKANKKIRDSFEKRYYINFFDNLFEDVAVRHLLSKSNLNQIATLGKKRDGGLKGTYEELLSDLQEIERQINGLISSLRG